MVMVVRRLRRWGARMYLNTDGVSRQDRSISSVYQEDVIVYVIYFNISHRVQLNGSDLQGVSNTKPIKVYQGWSLFFFFQMLVKIVI